ncbi:MAG: sigma-E processing peptidase SpoIIGA [Bacillota bacterium]
MSPDVNVYIDLVFLINFTMDFFILWAAAKLGKLGTTFTRLCFGAFIGAGYAVLIFLPQLTMLSTVFAKIFCSILMLLAAYGFYNFRRFLKSAAYFYLVSFIMGGAVLGSMYLFDTNPNIIETWNGIAVNVIDFRTAWLLVGLAVAIILGIWGASYVRRNLHQGPWLVKGTLEIFGELIDFDALVDTGNQLVDPISKEPVMVIEYKKLAAVLPPVLEKILGRKEIPPLDQQLSVFSDDKWQTRLRLIPFSSLGNQNGMLIGFKPDKVMIRDGENRIINTKIVVGIYHLRLCSQGSYQALIHPDMLNGE